MGNNKELFDYWYDRVKLKNLPLIEASRHVETYKLRHECTNYDSLWQSPEVNALNEPERSKVIAIIKYECTAKVLQRRASFLREQAIEFQATCQELDRKQSRLLGLIKALQEKLFGKDQTITRLEARINALASEKAALQAELDNQTAHTELMDELGQLKKQYAKLEKRKQELAKTNQSLGGRVAHTERYRRQRDEAKATITTLKAENQQLHQENQALRSSLEQLQQLVSDRSP